jgi:hypothetical protein
VHADSPRAKRVRGLLEKARRARGEAKSVSNGMRWVGPRAD